MQAYRVPPLFTRGEADPPLFSDVCRYVDSLAREERPAAWERAHAWTDAAGRREFGNGPAALLWRDLGVPVGNAMRDTGRAARRALTAGAR
jgi:hypothetical protein